MKGGRFFADFGRLSKFHDHDLPFVNRPIVLDEFVGGESQGDGVETSWLVPIPHYLTLTAGAYNKVGGENDRVDNATPRDFSEFTYLGRAATFFNLTDAQSLDLGASYAYTPEVEDRGAHARHLGGVDLTYRYTPLEQAGYRGLVWGTEALVNQENRPDRRFHRQPTTLRRLPAARSLRALQLRRGPAVTPLLSRLSLRVRAGPRPRRQRHQAYSPYLTIWASEFQRFRLQYTRLDEPGRRRRPVLPAVDGRARQPCPHLPRPLRKDIMNDALDRSRSRSPRCLLAARPPPPPPTSSRSSPPSPTWPTWRNAVGGDLVEVSSIATGVEDIHAVPMKPSFAVTLNRADAVIVDRARGGARLHAGAARGGAQPEDPARHARLHRLLGGHRAARRPVEARSFAGRAAPDGQPALQPRSRHGQGHGARHRRRPHAQRPVARATYKKNLDAYLAELDAAIARWQREAAPLKGVKLVSYHPDLVYFADRFGMEPVGTIELRSPASSPTPRPRRGARGAHAEGEGRASSCASGTIRPGSPRRSRKQTGAKLVELPVMVGGVPEAKDYMSFIDYNVKTMLQAVQGG